MKKNIIILLLVGLAVSHTFAQPNNNKIVSLAMVKNGSITLRWVPASIPIWQMGNKYGYIVERYTIARDGNFIPDGLSKGTLLTPLPLKPLSNEAFEKLSQNDNRASVVQEAIYGNVIQSPADDFKAFMKTYNDVETRFGFALFMCDLSPVIAKAAGLQYMDSSVLANERYAYSISLVKTPEGLVVQPSVIVVDADKLSKLPKVIDVKAIFLDKTTKLRWPVDLHKGIYSAYILEKSTDGNNFAPVSELPLVTVSEKEASEFFVYTDSLKRNGEQTWYRVKGVSPFGENGPASDPVSGKGVPEFSAYVSIDTAEVIENKNIIIRWRVTEPKPGLVKGIIIEKSSKPDGPFQALNSKPLPPAIRSFTDLKPFISNYYRINLLATENRKSTSFIYLVQTEDNDPPAAPQMLSGKVDSSGIVTLAWRANSEPDLAGYRVYRANASHEQFVRRGRDLITTNRFRDTVNLNTLTRKVYYTVVAVDKHYNNSEYSLSVELTRPDTIPPAPGVITMLTTENDIVTLKFESSPSDDIEGYRLFRKGENDSLKVKVDSWKTLPGTYEDKPPVGSIRYNYILETFDNSGNHAYYCRNLLVPAGEQAVPELKIIPGNNHKTVILSWKFPAGFVPQKTFIYRGKEKNPPGILSTLEGAQDSYEDTTMEINTIYTYRIRMVGKNGASLPLSKVVSNEVKINR